MCDIGLTVLDNRTLVLLELLGFFPIFIQRILEFNTLSFPLNSLYGFLRDLALQFSIRNTTQIQDTLIRERWVVFSRKPQLHRNFKEK